MGDLRVNSSHCLAPSGGKKGFRTSAYLQDLACYIGQSVPFDEGSEILAKIGGIHLTDKQIERISHHYGGVLDELERADNLGADNLGADNLGADNLEMEVVEKEVVEKDSRLHYALMDGSMVYIRGQEEGWREMKLGRFFAASAAYQIKKRGVIEQSQYVAHLGGSEDFLKKFDRLISSKSNVVALGDGARWIWDYWSSFHPEARQILDYFHAIEKIGVWAALVFKDEKQKKDWMDYSESLLLNDQVGELILQIQNMDCHQSLKQAQLVTYLTNNQARMSYKTFLDEGLFIGSGAIEAANKDLIQKRFKLAGQRWTREGLQQVANLRVAYKSNQWQNVRHLIKIAA